MDNATVSWGTIAGVSLVVYVLYVAIGGLIIGALARWLLPGPDPMATPAPSSMDWAVPSPVESSAGYSACRPGWTWASAWPVPPG